MIFYNLYFLINRVSSIEKIYKKPLMLLIKPQLNDHSESIYGLVMVSLDSCGAGRM